VSAMVVAAVATATPTCVDPVGSCQAFVGGWVDSSNLDAKYPHAGRACTSDAHCSDATWVPKCGNLTTCAAVWDSGCTNWDDDGPGGMNEASPKYSCPKWANTKAMNNGYNADDLSSTAKTESQAHTEYCAAEAASGAQFSRHSRWPSGSGKCFFGRKAGVQKMKAENGEWYYECGCSQTSCQPKNRNKIILADNVNPAVWKNCTTSNGNEVSKKVSCRTEGLHLACFCPGTGKSVSNAADWDPTCQCMHGKAPAPVTSTCSNDDSCLQARSGWGSSYTCSASTKWCSSFKHDMELCCPQACGTCKDHTCRTVHESNVSGDDPDDDADCGDCSSTESSTCNVIDNTRIKCWNTMNWILNNLASDAPEPKYAEADPSLDAESTMTEIQRYVADNEPGKNCPQPCVGAVASTSNTSSTEGSSDTTNSNGGDGGGHANDDSYNSETTNTATTSTAAGTNTTNSGCSQCAVGNTANCDVVDITFKKCWNSMNWIQTNLASETPEAKYATANPPLDSLSSLPEIQKYLADYETNKNCPQPCTQWPFTASLDTTSKKKVMLGSSDSSSTASGIPAWPSGMKDCDWWANKVENKYTAADGIIKWCAEEAKKSNQPNWKYQFHRSSNNDTFTFRHGLQNFMTGDVDAQGDKHMAVVCSCKQTTCDGVGKCWSTAFVAGCYHSKHSCVGLGGAATVKSDMTEAANWCSSCSNALNEVAHAG